MQAALDFGTAGGDCGAGNAGSRLTFVADNDDFTDFDSFLSVIAPSTGVYSLLVTDLFGNDFPTEVTVTGATVVPLPPAAALLAASLGGLMAIRRRRS